MGRTLESFDLRDLLARNLDHPRFAETAERCLTCGNCTLVCPTCFCTSVEDVNVLADEPTAERWRSWDSCFSVDYSLHPRRQPCGPRRGRATASGSRTSSAPGSTSSAPPGASAAGAASPGARSGSTSPRSSPRSVPPTGRWIMQTLDEIVGESPVFDGLDADAARADRRLRARTRLSQAGERLFREGEPGRHLLPRAPRPGRARRRTSRPRRRRDRDARAGRGRSAGRGSSRRTRWHFDARAVEDVRRGRVRRRVPARQVRGRPRARLRADAPLRRR